MTTIDARLTNFITDEVVVDGTAVGPDTDLLLSGAVDSLGVIRITHWIEDEFGVTVEPGDVTIENFQTVAKIAAFVGERTS